MKIPDLTPIDSSSIEAVGYVPGEARLFVRFVTRKTYMYEGITQETYLELIRAESIGRFFNRRIRDQYQFVEVGSDERPETKE
jgi:hypothetical protein